jgi:hypothetical protein
MGARINYVFLDGTDTSVVLYSHWGQDSWETDIAGALQHAKPRWGDAAYGTRMMISYLIKDNLMDETGFGIYSVSRDNYDLGDQAVFINFVDKTITDNVSVDWDKFILAYGSNLVNA